MAEPLIYTIGHRPSYDEGLGIAGQTGPTLMKRGPQRDYPGGYAFQTAADAQRRIGEAYPDRDFAIYAVDADWDVDVKPSANGWWGALQRDAVVLRKVEAAMASERRYDRERDPMGALHLTIDESASVELSVSTDRAGRPILSVWEGDLRRIDLRWDGRTWTQLFFLNGTGHEEERLIVPRRGTVPLQMSALPARVRVRRDRPIMVDVKAC